MSVTNVTHDHLGICSCCGSETACTRGMVELDGIHVASYLIKWTVGDPSHGMGWLVSLNEQPSGRRVSVSLSYSFEHSAFMVYLLGEYPWDTEDISGCGEILDRDRVIGTPLEEQVFLMVDEIWVNDPFLQIDCAEMIDLAKQALLDPLARQA